MSTQSETAEAVRRPWAVYATPEEVLDDRRLTDAQKRRILRNWECDARELAVAEEENMGGGEPAMLDRVLEALATLPAEDQQRPPSANDNGGPAVSGAKARQAEIVLKTPLRRAIFIGALGLAFIVFLFFVYLGWATGG